MCLYGRSSKPPRLCRCRAANHRWDALRASAGSQVSPSEEVGFEGAELVEAVRINPHRDRRALEVVSLRELRGRVVGVAGPRAVGQFLPRQTSGCVVRRAAVESLPWLWLPVAALELEAPATTGKFFSAARLSERRTVSLGIHQMVHPPSFVVAVGEPASIRCGHSRAIVTRQ